MSQKRQRPLNLEAIVNGIDACIENAEALLVDALLLSHNKRFARALTCILTADQEIGKVAVLENMAMLTPNKQGDWRDAWKRFYEHVPKVTMSFLARVPLHHHSDLDHLVDLALLADKFVSPRDESLRQESMYVDFDFANNEWKSPSQVSEVLVETRQKEAIAALIRLRIKQACGLLGLQSLRIKQEEYSKLLQVISIKNASKNASDEDYEAFLLKAQAIDQRAFQRLKDEGAVWGIPDGLTFYGVSWKAFLAKDLKIETPV